MNINKMQPKGMRMHMLFLYNLRTFCIAVTIPILVFGAFSLLLTRRYITNQVEINTDGAMGNSIQSFENTVQDASTLDVLLSSNPYISINAATFLQDTTKTALHDAQSYFRIITSQLTVKTASSPIVNQIYLYYPNDLGNFYSSSGTVENREIFDDVIWFDYCEKDYSSKGQKIQWIPVHTVGKYDYDKTRVITMIQNISSGSGVLIFNFPINELDKFFSSLFDFKTQNIIITTKDGNCIYSSDNSLIGENLNNLSEHFDNASSKIKGKHVIQKQSEALNLDYYLVSNSKEFYRLPIILGYITFAIFFACLSIGSLMAYKNAKREKHFIDSVVAGFNAARDEDTLPNLYSTTSDEYTSTLSKLIENFLKTDVLNVKLSEKMYQNKVLEMTALQAQMNPHFLYNTLNTLYWHIIKLTHGPSEETKMLEDLSDILRYALNSSQTLVSLKDEIDNANAYIRIQKVRFKDNFDVSWDIPENLMNCQVIKLIIQPLLENSIKHGYSSERKLLIKIAASRIDDNVRISCEDNGSGISESELRNIQIKLENAINIESHIGLYNTNKRIKLTFGKRYGLQISSKHERGTVVSILIPNNESQVLTHNQKTIEESGENYIV